MVLTAALVAAIALLVVGGDDDASQGTAGIASGTPQARSRSFKSDLDKSVNAQVSGTRRALEDDGIHSTAKLPTANLTGKDETRDAASTLQAAERAAGIMNWPEVNRLISLAESQGATPEDVAALKSRAKTAKSSAELIAVLGLAADRGDYAEALKLAAELPSEHPAQGRARLLLSQSRKNYLANRRVAMEDHVTGERWGSAYREASAILEVDKSDRRAKQISRQGERKLRAQGVDVNDLTETKTIASQQQQRRGSKPAEKTPTLARNTPQTRGASTPVTQPTAPSTSKTTNTPRTRQRGQNVDTPSPAPVKPSKTFTKPVSSSSAPAIQASAEDLVSKARGEWSSGRCLEAIASAKRALQKRRGVPGAHQIIAVCSCSLQDEASALASYNQLDGRTKTMVRTVCGRSGVQLPLAQ